MASLAVDSGDARRAVAAAARRVALLLADGVDTARPVPGLAWTVGETIAHVVTEMRVFAESASGELTREAVWDTHAPGLDGRSQTERFAALNAATIAGFDRTELGRGGELVEAAVGEFLSTTEGWPAGVPFRGVEGDLELATVTCVVLGELRRRGPGRVPRCLSTGQRIRVR